MGRGCLYLLHFTAEILSSMSLQEVAAPHKTPGSNNGNTLQFAEMNLHNLNLWFHPFYCPGQHMRNSRSSHLVYKRLSTWR